MDPLGLFHTSTAVAAIVVGAAVLLIHPKGSRLHRRLGWAYAISMLLLNVTALMIYRLFGGFGPFHVGAILSLATVVAGTLSAIAAARKRRSGDQRARAKSMDHHYYWMTFSYVGLLAAAVSEIATRLPAARPGPGQGMVFGIVVAVATLIVVGIGTRLIKGRAKRILAPFQPRSVAAATSPPS